jgi:hypothetical protein
MSARVRDWRNSLRLLNAPATEREFNVERTALDLMFAPRVAAPAVLGVIRPAALFSGVWAVVDRLPRELGDAAERDIAGLALM